MKHPVAAADEIPPGGRKIVEIAGRSDPTTPCPSSMRWRRRTARGTHRDLEPATSW
jgi:hypothetical protein